MSSKEVCEDCDPSHNHSENQIQPASASTMAHKSTKTQPIEIDENQFKPPVPIDPPSKAKHATEFTIHRPPTPENKIERNDDNDTNDNKEKGDLTPPEEQKQNHHHHQQQQQQQQHEEEQFISPKLNEFKPNLIIEFCDRCRWAPRATWIQTELFLTFPSPLIRTITLIPLNSPETGGRFRVWVDIGLGKGDELVWDRKTEGGFPELKVLKQRIRNLIQPDLNLGHSDVNGKQDK
ncbi:uncharacterized protein I206_103075 [Kwoniella pini CBS 10737]|uniref:Selenoprotein W n=1 Tax=Kwoniella pini CBS 10737 TaxID=1296096 RepID=A0A1B9IAJ8_9TREE|nr:uncharacterized protein I206_01921 [Kwoniella pini CBS 10737]OCF52628.1 hypothetical protein I206_01921 [Kwoniella pini CBS 10737]